MFFTDFQYHVKKYLHLCFYVKWNHMRNNLIGSFIFKLRNMWIDAPAEKKFVNISALKKVKVQCNYVFKGEPHSTMN